MWVRTFHRFSVRCQNTLMDPNASVRTADGARRVVLCGATESRASDVWAAVSDCFVQMGGSRSQVKAARKRLQTDPSFHYEWAVLLPVWCPELAHYVDVPSAVVGHSPDDGQ